MREGHLYSSFLHAISVSIHNNIFCTSVMASGELQSIIPYLVLRPH